MGVDGAWFDPQPPGHGVALDVVAGQDQHVDEAFRQSAGLPKCAAVIIGEPVKAGLRWGAGTVSSGERAPPPAVARRALLTCRFGFLADFFLFVIVSSSLTGSISNLECGVFTPL